MARRPPDLTQFFTPRSIAIVGVSASTGVFRLSGLSFLSRLLESRFSGRIYPINPNAGEIQGLKAYPDLSSLPEVPDLAMVCVAAPRVPGVLVECARLGLKHIHVLTAGFSETGTDEGKELEEQIADIARDKGLLIIGPNCMGPYCPSSGLTAWGAIPGRDGPLGIISQSGGTTQRLTEYACSIGIGVHKAASIGNAAVLDSVDYLEYMAEDEAILVIAMYLESVRDGKRLLRLARNISGRKPIILLKGGETEVGATTVASHTGRMAGEQELWEAATRQAGMIQTHSMNEWVDTLLAFCHLPGPAGNGVFLVGGGGGNSVIHADTCIREGLAVPPLSRASIDRLQTFVPKAGSIAGNPLDLFRTYWDPSTLAKVLDVAHEDPHIHMIIVDRVIPRNIYHMPEIPDRTSETIDYLIGNLHGKPTVITVDFAGGDPDLAAKGAAWIGRFCEAGIPAYPSVERAARALVHLLRYHDRFGH